MKEFKIGKGYVIRAWNYNTRNSWGHKAEIYKDHCLMENRQVKYYNRTWESFTYETIGLLLLEKYFKPNSKEYKKYSTKFKKIGRC
jgi:hypothetical protein